MSKKRRLYGSFWIDPDGNFFGVKINNRKKLLLSPEDLIREIEKEIKKSGGRKNGKKKKRR